jgi:spore maturation protein SpmA
VLNGLWLGFFGMAALAALVRWLVGGDPTVFAALVESLFTMARLAVEVMVLLFGTLTLWLGSCASPRRRGWSAGSRGCLGRCSGGSCRACPRGIRRSA